MDEGLRSLVLDTAPRLFAVVLEFGRGTADADGVVMAWGLADEDGSARVIDVDGRRTLHLSSPERALRWYCGVDGTRARLVWLAEPDSAVLDESENEVSPRAEAA
ncbi:hypothetical protein HUT18_12140 [Streptomyces sp. NA04227]|nr:hypothetical protein HUT18_12140 [Streptomyces sp. NA04227]